MDKFERIGNWYSVGFENETYNVLIQKEDKKILCDPSSILVFNEDFDKVDDPEIYEGIEKIMERVDWKYDMVDEED
jgi:hypothetical protein